MARAYLEAFLARERAQLPLWLPVLFGCGIALYFAPAHEPGPWTAPVAVAAATMAALVLGRRSAAAAIAAMALLALALGYAAALVRAHLVAAPVLAARIEASVEGRIVEVSRTGRGAVRLLLDGVVVHGLAAAATPARVRVTLLPRETGTDLLPGRRIIVHAGLAPPSAPVEPGGFDFRRIAWFDRLGAIGVARGVVLGLPDTGRPGAAGAVMLGLAALRARISTGLRAALPGETGGFAAAILVGDQSGLPEEAKAALRASNLWHLLSISGLHMGLLTGFVFVALRIAFALVPALVLRWPVRKAAALGAIAAGGVYLALSGAAVPAERSWIMVVVFFGALLIDRVAISLRSVAIAAGAILALMPEALVEIGFQMSFAATIALVAAYDALAGWRTAPDPRGIRGHLAMVAFTSLVAGTATAPFAALAFHQTATWGLVANMLAVPLMGFWIMPAGVIAGFLAPLGIEGPALAVMGAGIDAVMAVARQVAGFPFAVRLVPAPAAPVIVPLALGGLWFCLWRGRERLAGLALIAGALAWWGLSNGRPALLVAESGLQAGLVGPEGRALLTSARDSFAALEWLRADGDGLDPGLAALRPGLEREPDLARGEIGAWTFAVTVSRRPDPARLAALCQHKVLLVVPAARTRPPGPCRSITAQDLAGTGALAFTPKGGELLVRRAREPGEGRLWSRR